MRAAPAGRAIAFFRPTLMMVLDRRAAVAGDQPRGFEQNRLRGCALDRERGGENERDERYERFAGP